MEIERVTDPGVDRGDHNRSAIVNEPDMANQSLVEDRIDQLAVVAPPFGKPADLGSFTRRLRHEAEPTAVLGMVRPMPAAPHSMFARIYDLFMVPQDRFGLRHQRERLCGPANGRVLEIGIGTGLNIPHYRSADLVVGVDNHRGMLRRAIRRTWESSTPVDLVAADARQLPFPSASFDTVVVGFSLCTIPEPATALEEFARVTTPEGVLHFLEHERSAKPRTAKLQDRFAGVWGRVSGGCRANQDTRAILAESSWSVDDMWVSDGGGLIQGSATRG